MRLFRANIEDVPRIIDCAREFCALLGQKLNERYYQMFWEGGIATGSGVIFLLEHDGKVVGGIGGKTARELLSGEVYAVELFWYVKLEFRGTMWAIRLMTKFEQWARDCGCKEVAMIHMEKSMPEKLKEFYTRSGYVLDETVYRKKIGGSK